MATWKEIYDHFPKWTVLGILTGLVLGLILIGLIIFRIAFVTFVDNYELAFSFDQFDGKITRIEKTGYVIRNPIRYRVHTIDLRPYQVSISANARILNAKLIRFNPEGLEKFVEWHGRNAGDMQQNMLEILKSYAFAKDEGRDCPFLTVLSEIAPGQTPTTTVGKGGSVK